MHVFLGGFFCVIHVYTQEAVAVARNSCCSADNLNKCDSAVFLDRIIIRRCFPCLPSALIRTVQLYGQLFQRSKTTTAAATATAGAAGKTGETGAEKAGAEPSPVLTQQQDEQERQDDTTVVENSQDEDLESHEGLVSLVQASVDSFFGLLYAKVDQSLGVGPAGQPGARAPSGGGAGAVTLTNEHQQPQGGAGGGEGSAAEELDPVALGGVVAAVQQLVSDIEALDPHVPQVRRDRNKPRRRQVPCWRGVWGGISCCIYLVEMKAD